VTDRARKLFKFIAQKQLAQVGELKSNKSQEKRRRASQLCGFIFIRLPKGPRGVPRHE